MISEIQRPTSGLVQTSSSASDISLYLASLFIILDSLCVFILLIITIDIYHLTRTEMRDVVQNICFSTINLQMQRATWESLHIPRSVKVNPHIIKHIEQNHSYIHLCIAHLLEKNVFSARFTQFVSPRNLCLIRSAKRNLVACLSDHSHRCSMLINEEWHWHITRGWLSCLDL